MNEMTQFLKFEKDNCQPCKNLTHWLNENDVKHESKNVMQNMDLLRKYNIKSVPTLLKLDANGNELGRITGFDVTKVKGFIYE